jgi:CheY-like chemotaxis protein
MNKNYIMLVDDDADDRFLFGEAAKNLKNQLDYHTAEHGKHALEILKNTDAMPKLLFLDINMAEMNGWQFLVEAKKDLKLKDIPVVMYSTSAHSRDIQMASDLGAMCYCTKPESLEDLEMIINFVNDHHENGLKHAIHSTSASKSITRHLTCFI